jgi:hypothetical protein
VGRSFFQRSKDASVGFVARAAINAKLRGIGEVTQLSIDTKSKRIRLRVELIGEREAVDIDVIRYRLRSNDDCGARLTIEAATASRHWLDAALQQFVVGETFPIPAKAEALLRLLA